MIRKLDDAQEPARLFALRLAGDDERTRVAVAVEAERGKERGRAERVDLDYACGSGERGTQRLRNEERFVLGVVMAATRAPDHPILRLPAAVPIGFSRS
jgi:hypothetical protein